RETRASGVRARPRENGRPPWSDDSPHDGTAELSTRHRLADRPGVNRRSRVDARIRDPAARRRSYGPARDGRDERPLDANEPAGESVAGRSRQPVDIYRRSGTAWTEAGVDDGARRCAGDRSDREAHRGLERYRCTRMV